MEIIDGLLAPINWLVRGNPEFSMSITDPDRHIPGRHGDWAYSNTLESRDISLDLVKEVSLSEREEARRELFSFFPLGQQFDFVFEQLTYHAVLAGQIEVLHSAIHLEAHVPLRLVDPYGYGNTHTLIGPGVILNQGTVETYPQITIYGPVEDPEILFGQQLIQWNGELLMGESLVIDCLRMTVKKGNENALLGFNGVFPKIPSPLQHDMQEYAIDLGMVLEALLDISVDSDSEFKIVWQDRYL